MNSIHDMGGMVGLGAVDPEPNEPVFHDDWEGRVLGLRLLTSRWMRGRNMGSHRYELERMPAREYLRMSYYERWFEVLVDRLRRSDLVTETELAQGAADPERPTPELRPPSSGDQVSAARLDLGIAPRFQSGDEVRARNINPAGHIRLPRYARGKCGQVVRHHGIFGLQDTDETGRRGGDFPQHVYTVRFSAQVLWGSQGGERDSVFVDLWEGYLEPV